MLCFRTLKIVSLSVATFMLMSLFLVCALFFVSIGIVGANRPCGCLFC